MALATSTPPPFFAPIIGIKDAQKVESFHIRNFRDTQATRENILSELKALETTPHINPGGPILIQ